MVQTALGVVVPSSREVTLQLLAWFAVALLAGLLAAALGRSLPRGRLLPPQRRASVAWSGVDVFLAFLGMLLWPQVIHMLLLAGRTDERPTAAPGSSLLESVLAFPFVLG